MVYEKSIRYYAVWVSKFLNFTNDKARGNVVSQIRLEALSDLTGLKNVAMHIANRKVGPKRGKLRPRFQERDLDA